MLLLLILLIQEWLLQKSQKKHDIFQDMIILRFHLMNSKISSSIWQSEYFFVLVLSLCLSMNLLQLFFIVSGAIIFIVAFDIAKKNALMPYTSLYFLQWVRGFYFYFCPRSTWFSWSYFRSPERCWCTCVFIDCLFILLRSSSSSKDRIYTRRSYKTCSRDSPPKCKK